jgi:hypothetical protein
MADTAAAATPAKSPKKKTAAKPKKPSAHPKYSEMVGKAISAPILKDPDAPVPFDCFKLLFFTPALSESFR